VKFAITPNALAIIKLQEDASKPAGDAAPPPVPPGGNPAEKPEKPEKPGEAGPKKTSTLPGQERQGAAPAWEPTVGSLPVPSPNNPGVGISKPIPLPPQGSGSPVAPLASDRIAEGAGVPRPPKIEIPGKGAPKPELPLAGDPTPVPSCALFGKHLMNFALRDLNGQPWEYRKQKRGKLVLLDFWSTACVPCLHAIPELRRLKERYGPHGLEIIGIAYENGGTPQEQARRVREAAARHKIDYTLLLGAGNQCPVLVQFGVQRYPTLVLISENGWIIWEHPRNQLESHHLSEMERTIQRWLRLN
jgi:thiol-disulfide isomerase/thioredoxin